MKANSDSLPDDDQIVSVQEFKYLLSSILDRHANIRVKYQLREEIWTDHYLRVLLVTEKGVIFNDERNNKTTAIKFLGDISRFELDKPFESYRYKLHYALISDAVCVSWHSDHLDQLHYLFTDVNVIA